MNVNTPAQIGRYLIQRKLNEGGMAEIFLAYDPHVDREVAIKLIHSRMADDPSLKRRFLQEARSLAALEHSAIVPIYDYGEEDNKPYFVMRFMSGGSLQDRLVRGIPPITEALRILQRMAGALDVAHERGIVHRDIKPSNILFDPYNDPYVADFGIAKLVQNNTNLAGGVGGTTMFGGTPKYMSPEQCRGETDLDGRSDVYALGLTMYELLTGVTPFASDTAYGYIYLHINQPPPPLQDTRPDLPLTLDGILRQALAKEKYRRFATDGLFASAVTDELRGLPDFQPLSATVPKLSPKPTSRSNPPGSNPPGSNPPSSNPPGTPLRDEVASPPASPTPRSEPNSATIAKPNPRSNPPQTPMGDNAPAVVPTPTPTPRTNPPVPVDQWHLPPTPRSTPTPRSEPFAATIAKPSAGSQPPVAPAAPVAPPVPASRTPLYLGIGGAVLVILLLIGAALAFTNQGNQANVAVPTTAALATDGAVAGGTDINSAPTTAPAETAATGAPDATATMETSSTTAPPATTAGGAAASSRPTPSLGAMEPLVREFTSASLTLVHQPSSGDLVNQPTLVALSSPASAVQDFIATAEFTNPMSGTLWSYGFLFRDASGGDNYRLFITGSSEWYLLLQEDFAVTPNFITVASGTLPDGALMGAGGQNTLTLAAQGARGRFWLNDQLVTDLDLSANIEISPLYVGAFFFGDDRADGVRYDKFSVWRLR